MQLEAIMLPFLYAQNVYSKLAEGAKGQCCKFFYVVLAYFLSRRTLTPAAPPALKRPTKEE